MPQVIEQYGPYGSQEKLTFNFILEKGDVITRVRIDSGDVTDALAFEILDTSGNYTTIKSDGTVTPGKLDDSSDGKDDPHAHETETLKLNGERITQISGYEGDYFGNRHVVQLLIHTDVRPDGYGPFGHKNLSTNIEPFSSPDPSTGPIVGFFGAQGTYLHSLGVSLQKAPKE
ncbi:uncharacterized protein LOC141645820 isoform X1 [Silene latifolia]|uniref:uncharacterized protein LOC141645820 isoform X1 n=1 Tax=Silene latifolia TaxID=37657 RepID=UPI003D76E4B2